MILPLELLGSIADTLAEDDDFDSKATLKVLSLTCKSLVSPCRRHIFSSLSLTTDGPLSQRFSKMLRKCPHVASYVKDLSYDIFSTTVISSDQYIIETILRRSSILQSVAIRSLLAIDWSVTSAEKLASLYIPLFQLPTITHLNLKYFTNLPVAALSLCSRLIDLDLEMVTLTTHGVIYPITRTIIPTPKLLTIDEKSYSALETLMQPAGSASSEPIIDFSRLQEAYLDIRSVADLHTIGKLLNTTTSLQCIDMSVNPVPLLGLGVALAINGRRTLRTATFGIMIEGDHYDPLCGLNLELKRLVGNNVLEELDFSLDVQTDMECRADSSDWSDLDTVLTGSGAFPMLREVSISLTWNSFGRSNYEELEKKLTKNRFPQLSDSKSIKFKFLVEQYWV